MLVHRSWRVVGRAWLGLMLGSLMLGSLMLGGCDDSPSALAPAPASTTPSVEIPAHFEGFRYAPTLVRHAPASQVLAPVAEIGGPTGERLHAVVVTFEHGQPRLSLWTFEHGGPQGVLQPTQGPSGLDEPDRATLREAMAAPRAVVYRPQGIDVAGPRALLDELRALATKADDPRADPLARVVALATLARGLGDERWLEVERLQARLGDGLTLADGGDVSKYRAQLTATDARGTTVPLILLKKRKGWVLESMAPP